MTERLTQVNRLLDRACKRAGLDTVEVRLAMVQTLQAKLQTSVAYLYDEGSCIIQEKVELE